MNGDNYIDFLRSEAVSLLQTLFPGGSGIFEQDWPLMLISILFKIEYIETSEAIRQTKPFADRPTRLPGKLL